MHITYAMVRDGMPRVIETKGDQFVYNPPRNAGGTCQYIWDGEPDCLIACYLVDLGVPIEAFDTGEDVMGIDELISKGHLEEFGVTVEPEAMHAMSRIQSLQDDQYPWGDAYRMTFEYENEEK